METPQEEIARLAALLSEDSKTLLKALDGQHPATDQIAVWDAERTRRALVQLSEHGLIEYKGAR